MEREDSRGQNFQGNFYTGEICQNSYTKLLYMSSFLFTDTILLMVMLRLIAPGNFCQARIVQRIFMSQGGFFRGGATRYPGVIQNDQKLNKKVIFSTESKEQH